MFEVINDWVGVQKGEKLTIAELAARNADADIHWLIKSGALRPIGDAASQLRTERPTVDQLLDECEQHEKDKAELSQELERVKNELAELKKPAKPKTAKELAEEKAKGN